VPTSLLNQRASGAAFWLSSMHASAGPEVGLLFPVGEMQGSLSLRGYWEFAAQNRSSGWNTWLAFSIAPTEKAPTVAK